MYRRKISDEGSARADATMFVAVIFVATYTLIALTTNPVYSGVSVGDLAPELEGDVWNGNTWTDYKLEDRINTDWQPGMPGTWIMIEFMDTNCGACVSAAKNTIPQAQNYWLGNPDIAEGLNVEFLAVSISLWDSSVEGKEYGRTVIQDFRSEHSHQFNYMDGQDNAYKDLWEVQGTPSYYLIAPNGIVQFSSPEGSSYSTVFDAMNDLIPTGDD